MECFYVVDVLLSHMLKIIILYLFGLSTNKIFIEIETQKRKEVTHTCHIGYKKPEEIKTLPYIVNITATHAMIYGNYPPFKTRDSHKREKLSVPLNAQAVPKPLLSVWILKKDTDTWIIAGKQYTASSGGGGSTGVTDYNAPKTGLYQI